MLVKDVLALRVAEQETLSSKMHGRHYTLNQRQALHLVIWLVWLILELCHGKTCLKIFVAVIPKEGLTGGGPTNPFGMTPTIEYNL